jgi:hypothetical protein
MMARRRKERASFKKVCASILDRAKQHFPSLRGTRIRLCDEADDEHECSARQFCHVGHLKGAICYARATDSLPFDIQVGLAVHEIGHLVGFCIDTDHSENDANYYGEMVTGIPVEWHGPLRLERATVIPKWVAC